MNELSFKKATRQGVKPLVGLYAESGCGKTMSALLLARGMAGVNGKVGMVDTESGRGSLYADVIPGGYEVIELDAPFSPARYVACIEAAESAGIDVLVIDSMSHEWEGVGGVLDMAGDNEARSGKAGLHNWKTPKLEHNKLVLKLLQSRLAIICCIRAKFKSRQTRENGKTVIVKDDHVSPIQSEEFIFEMTAHAEILSDHTIRLSKCSHPGLRGCFPEDNKEPLSIKHGEAIAAWANNASGAKVTDKPTAKKPLSLKGVLWKLVKGQINNDPAKLAEYMLDNGLMVEGEDISALNETRLSEIIEKVKGAQNA